MSPLRVLHLNTQFTSMGGLEAVLRRHHQEDARFDLDSRVVVYYESVTEGWPRARFLGFTDGTSISEARALQRNALADFEVDVAVYHTVWGIPYLADLDRSRRRVLMLHSDIPGLDRFLNSRLPWMDAVIAVSQTLLDRAAEAAPGLGFGPERLHLAPYPVNPPVQANPSRPDRNPATPLVIGYCGRLVREQKRVERLVELAAHLDRAGVAYRLELLGEGPERPALEAALPKRPGIVFHGRKSGTEYWDVLRSWDVMVFTSDYEGTPIALLEGLAAGVLPVHPELNCGGDHLASRVSPSLVFPAGDVRGAATALQHLASWPAGEWRQLRERAAAAVEPHLGDRYLTGISTFLKSLPRLPDRPKPPFPPRPWPVDHLAFSTLDTISSLKRRMLGGGR